MGGACDEEPNCVVVRDKCDSVKPKCSASCVETLDHCVGKYDCDYCQSIINGDIPGTKMGGACDKEPNCVVVSDKCDSVKPECSASCVETFDHCVGRYEYDYCQSIINGDILGTKMDRACDKEPN